jgi:hypothetical protein
MESALRCASRILGGAGVSHGSIARWMRRWIWQRQLSRLNAVTLRPEQFGSDCEGLIKLLKQIVGTPEPSDLRQEDEVTFRLPAEYRTHPDPIYLVGSFNRWLNAMDGSLNVDEETLRKYRLATVGDNELHGRQITLRLPPASYQFKFVAAQAGRYTWLPWVAVREYEKGDDAHDGPNFKIKVG